MSAILRIVRVDADLDQVCIQNFGAATDVTTVWLCAGGMYGQLGAFEIVSGSLEILAGGALVVAVGFDLAEAGSDLALFQTNDFESAAAMLDFVQWGAGGQDREAVAVTKGIWTAGSYLMGVSPYVYTGDGSAEQVGPAYWTSEADLPPAPRVGFEINIYNNCSEHTCEDGHVCPDGTQAAATRMRR